MNEIRILGLYINHKSKDEAVKLQNILSKYGCIIRTRLGLNNMDENYNSKNGLIILELVGPMEEILHLENELININGLQIDRMIFISER